MAQLQRIANRGTADEAWVSRHVFRDQMTMATTFPPGPADWTFGVSLARGLKYKLIETYEKLHRDYGDRVYCRVGPIRLYFFFHPDDVREVLVTHSKTIIRDPRPLKVFAQWNGNSMLIAEGEQWVRQRRLVQPAFQSRRFAGKSQTRAICCRCCWQLSMKKGTAVR